MSGTSQQGGDSTSGRPELAALLSTRPDRRLTGRNLTKADILVYRLPGVDLAVKDYSARPWWIRHTLGRWLLRREAAAYRAAHGAAGVPEFFGRLGRFALATRWIEARPLAEHPRTTVGEEVFDRLEAVVAGLHERGVALADLHHRDVLVTAAGAVFVVDLATACVVRAGSGGLRRSVFERCRDADRVALARMRARWTGGDEAAAVERAGRRAAAWHRRGRRLRAAVRRLRGAPR